MASRAHHGPRPLRPIAAEWAWQQNARCRSADPNLFFHPEGERGAERDRRYRRAVQFCADCPVRDDCAAHALLFGEDYGTWGGMSEGDRLRSLGKGRSRRAAIDHDRA
ncbi:WhiB family transcriptional regulator [Mycolicibacterium fortuitum]|uniref:Transcriptional regulator WhiB n=2 Tax=Mycolicibacterium fortuitum TaxID=1766 RepID=K0VD10_MYCFO|nr:WhiB family transcriptional regulator [Mycolicibacterium fortuitum]EJZ15565.1 putative WhiB family transcriptional regulator [Mycolicibacterium fortuitum subsp. fortuitum DSM 46621 = ATCC 6841 = JCM 6387]WEV33275.1 WhiB family transcriptional regulator [Mycolicibacterium fortuitum]